MIKFLKNTKTNEFRMTLSDDIQKDEVELISKSLIVGMEQSSFGAEILVNDRNAARKLYPEMVLESAALEEIMIYYVNSKRGE